MSNSYFQFKQFTVWHDKCGMKVGTDGVLLGAWTRVTHSKRILDVGTGTGLVSLMLAQRSDALITAIDIDADAVMQAKENVEKSPWAHRIAVEQHDFTSYQAGALYDTIVCNPPYFIDSLKSPDKKRATARHTDELTYEDLFKGVALCMESTGEFTMIAPFDVYADLVTLGGKHHLYPIRSLLVITKPGSNPKRVVVTFSFTQQPCDNETLLTEISRHQYSEEYIALTRDYYLNM